MNVTLLIHIASPLIMIRNFFFIILSLANIAITIVFFSHIPINDFDEEVAKRREVISDVV